MKQLVLFSSVEMIESRLQELLNYIFDILNKHKDAFNLLEVSNDEASNQDQSKEELLLCSTLDILQAIAIRFEKETQNKNTMITEIMHHLNACNWTPTIYASKILVSISSKSTNPEKSGDILQDNITQVFIHIYNKINTDFSNESESRLKISADKFKAQVTSVLQVLSRLYQFRSESHAFNHTSSAVIELFKVFCDIEPKIEGLQEEDIEDSYDATQGKSDVYSLISQAFTSYFDNLVFRQSVEAQYINELPSIKNRLKVTEEMITLGHQKEVFNIAEESKSEAAKMKKKGKWNYIQLIQLAISILYSSRLAFDKVSELQKINSQKYSFEHSDFKRLIDPIVSSLENDEKLSKRMFDLVVDWINKMLKYQQMFNAERSDVFGNTMMSVVPILWTKASKTLLTWSVIVNYATMDKGTAVSSTIPKFLKLYDDEEGKIMYSLKLIFYDFEYDPSEEDDNLRHIKDFKSKLEDIEVSEAGDSPNTQAPEIKAMINRLENEADKISRISMTSRSSIVQASNITLEEPDEGLNDDESSERSSESILGFVKGLKDYSYSIQDSHSVSISDINFK